MGAQHRRAAAKAEATEKRRSRPPVRRDPAGSGVWDALVQTARAVLDVRVARCEVELVASLDDHMLADIGVESDAVRRDTPRYPWPH